MLRVLLHLWENPLFGREKSEIVYSIREMSSSRAGFVVPDRCETWIDLHLQPEMDPALLQRAIRQIATTADSFIPGLDLQVDFNFASPGYNLGVDNPISQSLPGIYRSVGVPLRLDAFRSHSDGNLFFAAGTKPIILGPGALEVAHTPGEQVTFSEVTAAAGIYAALCLEADGLGSNAL